MSEDEPIGPEDPAMQGLDVPAGAEPRKPARPAVAANGPDAAAAAMPEDGADPAAGGAPDTRDGTDGDEGADGADEAADLIEFDFGGNKARFARDARLADVAESFQGYARQVTAGANQKFQEAAEIRKTAEAARASLDELSELNTDALEAYAQAAQIRDRVRALEAVDLPRLWQADPDRARRLSDDLARARQAQDRAMAQLDGVQTDLRGARDARRDRAMAEGRQKVDRLDPGFAGQAEDVVAYVQQAYGLSAEQAQSWPLAPEMAVMARKAMLWDRAQAAAKTRPPTATGSPPRPVRPLGGTGGRPASGPHDRQGVEAWMRERNRQLSARRGR